MHPKPTVSQLVSQYSLFSQGDKLAVSKLLGVREQFILKELVRRQRQKEKLSGRHINASSGDIFFQCSGWLSCRLFNILDQDPATDRGDSSTPAVRALVRDIYEVVGGNMDLSVDEVRGEKKFSIIRFLLGPKYLSGWMEKLK